MTTILTVDEQSWARASFSWALAGNHEAMDRCLKHLPPKARAATVLATDTLLSALMLELLPDSLPEGVEGHPVGQREVVGA